MSEAIKLEYQIDGKDFALCGKASEAVKHTLRQLGIPADIIRRAAIAMYEGEINMVIHANGGIATVLIFEDKILIRLADVGPGISDIEKAMQEGYSTATESIRELGFGAGMGLPNMKKYTSRMNIDSKVGVGTTLTLEIDF